MGFSEWGRSGKAPISSWIPKLSCIQRKVFKHMLYWGKARGI